MIDVHSSRGSYPVEKVVGNVTDLAARIEQIAPTGRFFVVGDAHTAPLYAAPLHDALVTAGRGATLVTVPASESAKSIEPLVELWSALLQAQIERNDVVIAVGGGVVGDLAGFAASTIMRGVRVIQVATTVIAMADSAIGGKTGINLPEGKNLVGTFHPPAAVLCYLPALKTLSRRELRSGVAEIIKSAWIDGDDAVLAVEALAHDADPLAQIDAIGELAAMAASIKARIVTADEFERGERRLLNLGHTFGHAIEAGAGYGEWTHGEAVAAGMVLAAATSVELNLLDADGARRLVRSIAAFGLPVRPPEMSVESWMQPMRHDKKRTAESVRLVLLSGPGRVFAREISYYELTVRFAAILDRVVALTGGERLA